MFFSQNIERSFKHCFDSRKLRGTVTTRSYITDDTICRFAQTPQSGDFYELRDFIRSRVRKARRKRVVDKIAPQLAANFRAEEKTAVLPPALLKDSGEHRALQFYARVHDLLESDFICPGGRFCHKNCHQDVRREFANALSIGKQNF